MARPALRMLLSPMEARQMCYVVCALWCIRARVEHDMPTANGWVRVCVCVCSRLCANSSITSEPWIIQTWYRLLSLLCISPRLSYKIYIFSTMKLSNRQTGKLENGNIVAVGRYRIIVAEHCVRIVDSLSRMWGKGTTIYIERNIFQTPLALSLSLCLSSHMAFWKCIKCEPNSQLMAFINGKRTHLSHNIKPTTTTIRWLHEEKVLSAQWYHFPFYLDTNQQFLSYLTRDEIVDDIFVNSRQW